jgi:hypothetical protein
MCFPSIRLIWADQGYSGTLVTWAATSLNITLQIVRKLADQTGFVSCTAIIMTRRLARDTNRPQTKAT